MWLNLEPELHNWKIFDDYLKWSEIDWNINFLHFNFKLWLLIKLFPFPRNFFDSVIDSFIENFCKPAGGKELSHESLFLFLTRTFSAGTSRAPKKEMPNFWVDEFSVSRSCFFLQNLMAIHSVSKIRGALEITSILGTLIKCIEYIPDPFCWHESVFYLCQL